MKDGNFKKPSGAHAVIALSWVLKGLLLMSLFYVIASNIEPYSIWVAGYLEQALTGWVRTIPFFGTFLNAAAKFAGIIIWAVVQIFEVFPSLLLGSVLGLEILISAFTQHQKENGPAQMPINPGDDPMMRFLKSRFNKINLAPVNFWRRVQPIAYIVDLVILVQVFPPLKDGYGWQEILMTMNFGGLDWGNVIQAIITMFALEGVIYIWTRLDQTIYLIRRGLKAWNS